MRMTIGMLRRIIREEVTRNLLRENESDPLAAFKALEKEIEDFSGDFQKTMVELRNETGDKKINQWINTSGLGYSLKSIYTGVTAVRRGGPNMSENWQAFSGGFLADLQEFAEFCTKFYPDNEELANLHERGEKLLQKMEDALPEEGRRENNAPWSEKSEEEKERRKFFDNNQHRGVRNMRTPRKYV